MDIGQGQIPADQRPGGLNGPSDKLVKKLDAKQGEGKGR